MKKDSTAWCLRYDLYRDKVIVDKGTIFQEHLDLCHGDRFEVKRGRKWNSAVLYRDIGGWYLSTEYGKSRDLDGLQVKILRWRDEK